MPLMEIKNRFDGSVLYSGEALTMTELLENAVKDGANLVRANLDGASLYGANLDGANLAEGITISKKPTSISTTTYSLIVFDAHMRIGCKFYSLSEWWGFDDHDIIEMDGKRALEFWRKWKAPLQAICAAEGRA